MVHKDDLTLIDKILLKEDERLFGDEIIEQ